MANVGSKLHASSSRGGRVNFLRRALGGKQDCVSRVRSRRATRTRQRSNGSGRKAAWRRWWGRRLRRLLASGKSKPPCSDEPSRCRLLALSSPITGELLLLPKPVRALLFPSFRPAIITDGLAHLCL